MGNNNYLTWGILAVLVAAGLWWWSSSASNGAAPTNNSTSTEEESVSGSENTTLKALIAANRPVQCSYTQEGNTGTVYVANSKMRGDFDVKESGKTTKGHMIGDGSSLYIWMDGMTQGFKTAMNGSSSTSAQANTPNVDEKLDYDCKVWTADSSKFTLPTNVTFSSMGSVTPPTTPSTTMNGMMGY